MATSGSDFSAGVSDLATSGSDFCTGASDLATNGSDFVRGGAFSLLMSVACNVN
ncbi:hypothetical protein [Virgibacillus dokdonensis]|uniref:hypothetical protein n=1 Tax=Virgibacillus dokdonensis TaxID=302167 RepID=UPI001C6E550B|nr:hypothetical protein [Virgibacillus dokdonensis]